MADLKGRYLIPKGERSADRVETLQMGILANGINLEVDGEVLAGDVLGVEIDG